jgi:hypothetical protein
VQLSRRPSGASLNQSATSLPGIIKARTVNAVCLFFLVLPCLALAAIVWWGTLVPANKRPEDSARYARASSAQAASQVITSPSSLQEPTGTQAVSKDQSDLVIRKVKTQPISAGLSAGLLQSKCPSRVQATTISSSQKNELWVKGPDP